MRTNGKRFVAVGGAVLAIALAVTACGSSTKSGDSSASGGGSSSLPSSIKLISIQDLTGVAGVQGAHTKLGMEAAVNEINSTGFLGSSKIELTVQDSATNATTGASLMSQAATSSSPIVFGSILSSNAVAEAPIAQRAKAPTIFTQAGSDGVVSAGNYIFRATPLQTTYLQLSQQYIQKQNYKNVGMLTVTDVPTITAIASSFEANAGKYGYTIVDKEETTSKATALAPQLTKILSKKPDAIIVLASSGQNPTVVSQLRAAGYTGPIIGQQGMGGGALKTLGAQADGVYWATDFNAEQTNAGAKQFVSAFAKTGSGTPDNFGAEGYDAMWLAARALKDAGSVDREKVLASLTKVASAGFTGALGDVKFVDRSEVAPGVLVQWKDGKEVPVS